MATPQFAQLARARGLEPTPMVGAELEAHVREQVQAMRELARGLGLRVP
jgi:tripartite-type tricarboxylate transporter receptor subunit TctC